MSDQDTSVMKRRYNCYFGCVVHKGESLHRFPACKIPFEERYMQWKAVLSHSIQERGYDYLYNNVRICGRHFEEQYKYSSGRIARTAVPTLNLDLPTFTGVIKNIPQKETNRSAEPFTSITIQANVVGWNSETMKCWKVNMLGIRVKQCESSLSRTWYSEPKELIYDVLLQMCDMCQRKQRTATRLQGFKSFEHG